MTGGDLVTELVTFTRVNRGGRYGTVTQPHRVSPHGTLTGYRRHWRRGEPACGPCLAANAAESARNRQRAKAAAS